MIEFAIRLLCLAVSIEMGHVLADVVLTMRPRRPRHEPEVEAVLSEGEQNEHS